MSIQNINENIEYDGYFCKKCNSIPIIQIIPKDTITKILSAFNVISNMKILKLSLKINH